MEYVLRLHSEECRSECCKKLTKSYNSSKDSILQILSNVGIYQNFIHRIQWNFDLGPRKSTTNIDSVYIQLMET